MLTRALVEKGTQQLATHLEPKSAVVLGIGHLQPDSATVFIIAAVVVTTDIVASEADVHAVVQAGVVHPHRVEPTVELGEVVVETQLLLHRQAPRSAQAYFSLSGDDAAKVGRPFALRECPNRE